MQYHQVVYACVSNGVITSHNSGMSSHNTTDVIKKLCPMSYSSLSTVYRTLLSPFNHTFVMSSYVTAEYLHIGHIGHISIIFAGRNLAWQEKD